MEVHNLIFRSGSSGKYSIREGILRNIESLVHGGQTKELISAPKEGNGFVAVPEILDRMMQDPGSYDDYERSLALICESSLDVGELGTVQRFLNKYPKMKEQFKN